MRALHQPRPYRINTAQRKEAVEQRKPSSSFTRVVLMLVALLIVAIIGLVNSQTRNVLSIYVFYAAPIFMSVWYVGRIPGVSVALVSVLSWFLADLGDPSVSVPLTFINLVMRLAFFISIALVLDTLRATVQRERDLGRKDDLTGLANRRKFFEVAANERNRAQRYGAPFSLAYLDIDNFKSLNDTEGHQFGDCVLQNIAIVLKASIRKTDLAARLGGDEFVILFPETGFDAVKVAISKIKNALLKEIERRRWPVGVSIGVATFETARDDEDEMLRKADQLMYAAKLRGKNAIEYQKF